MTVNELFTSTRLKLDEYNLKEWQIAFHATKRSIGLCQYDKKRLSFSIYWLDKMKDYEWNNIILHEIAHALTGPGHGHDRLWRTMAHNIGLKVAEDKYGCGELTTIRDMLT